MSHSSVDYIAQLPHIQALPLKPVRLPGTDYIAGPTLFPGRVLYGYNAEPSQYNADTWAAVILKHAQSNAATSCVSYSAINSGSTGGRFWFGYIFVGGPVDASDFVQGDPTAAVEGSRAYSIEAVSAGHATDITNIDKLPKSQNAPPYPWKPVIIPGPAYVPGPSIFPKNVIGAWDAHQDDYDTQDKWAAYVLTQTDTFYPQATSVATYSAVNPGGKGRRWIGYSFIGTPITGDDFVRGDRDQSVRGALAFTIDAIPATTSAQDAHNVEFIAKLPKFAPSQLHLKPVVLPGPNYIPGPYLFPGNVIAGYSANYADYDQTTWAAYVLKQTQGYEAATSCASFSAINSGTGGGRYWFGYSFRGGPVDGSDFVKGDISADVRGAEAYSIEAVGINDLDFIAKFSKPKSENISFHSVPLPGTNYIAGPILSSALLTGRRADPQEEYTAESWAKHVLGWVQTTPGAASCVSFSAIDPVSKGGRYWVGYVYGRAAVSFRDFVAAPDVEGSFAFTI